MQLTISTGTQTILLKDTGEIKKFWMYDEMEGNQDGTNVTFKNLKEVVVKEAEVIEAEVK